MGSSKPKSAPKASPVVAKKAVAKKTSPKPAPKKTAVTPKVSKAPVAKKSPVPSNPRKSVQPSPVPAAPLAAPPRPVVPVSSFEPTIDEGANPGYILNSEVLDEAEQAQMLQLQEQATISYRAREMNRPETHPDFDGLHCVDCDDEIPALRLALRRVRCVHCQELLEEERKRHQRTMG